MFVDTLELFVVAGNGGNGKTSFRREKYVPKGGPDGGDGGDGGNVLFVSSDTLSTFLDIARMPTIKAGHGQDGEQRKKSGRRGDDAIVTVPCGTSIYNGDDGTLIYDLVNKNDSVVIAQGGKGGKGNTHFSSSRIRTPQKSTPGQSGNQLNLRLELNVIADVGMVGYPNAGKSTLLKTLTQANPKIASYPFTTLYPNIGILRRYDKDIVIADIPGIIEGASNGVGLGNQFLKHIHRTRMLLILIEAVPESPETVLDVLNKIHHELRSYDASLLKKHIIIGITKTDLITNDDMAKLNALFSNQPVHMLSCFSGYGTDELEKRIFDDVT